MNNWLVLSYRVLLVHDSSIHTRKHFLHFVLMLTAYTENVIAESHTSRIINIITHKFYWWRSSHACLYKSIADNFQQVLCLTFDDALNRTDLGSNELLYRAHTDQSFVYASDLEVRVVLSWSKKPECCLTFLAGLYCSTCINGDASLLAAQPSSIFAASQK